MRDCTNIEIREMLPERAAGMLPAESERRVSAHLADCADCVAELEVLRAARAVMRREPAVDVRRITANVSAATRQTPGTLGRARRHWVELRAAAAIVLVAFGATVTIWKNRGDDRAGAPDAGVSANAPAARGGITLTAGLSELTDAQVESLLDDIEHLDAAGIGEPRAVEPYIDEWGGV